MNPSPTILVLFGATGDLVTRKIGPTLSRLQDEHRLPERFAVIGFSRRDYTDETFRATFPQPNGHFFHVKGELSDPQDFHALAGRIKELETSWGKPARVLFFLALSPRLHGLVLDGLEAAGLAGAHGRTAGVLVEKPFGEDLASAQALDARLSSLFTDQDIYRIDHYLAKEMVRNIMAFRFANQLFEPTWNDSTIERIEVRFFEAIGVQTRGSTYESLGALRDAGQNHLLQMLAAVTMPRPASIAATDVRAARADILRHLETFTVEGVQQRTRRAQVAGYRDLNGVDPTSETETFFQIETRLAHPAWKRTDIVLSAGKSLPVAEREILVTLRHPEPCLCPSSGHIRNTIRIVVEPEEHIQLAFWALQPGSDWTLEPRTFDFLLRKPGDVPGGGYDRLLLYAIMGDQTVFASREEIEASWRFIDPIRKAWDHKHAPLTFYEEGTWPKSAQ